MWLRATIDVLNRRIKRRGDRPLLKGADAAETLRRLLEEREPIYAQADFTVESRDVPHETIVDEILEGLRGRIAPAGARPDGVRRRAAQRGRAMTAPLRSGEPINVNVGLGDRAYDIAIGRGLLASLGERIAKLRPGCKVAVVTDETVARHHLAAAEAALTGAGIGVSSVKVPAGESSKSFRQFERVCDALLAAKIERGDLVVALGGGVVGDLAGFAASVIRRGVDYVQVPTTLLAQVDSSVGGKTAINARAGQEPGRRVLSADPGGGRHRAARHAAGARIPRRLCRGGEIRVARRCRVLRMARRQLARCVRRRQFFRSFAREHAIAVSCRAKAAIVARDERETGDRMLLNLGHTFGHAFEAAAGFSDRLLHGEAVGLGMALAFEFSARRGLIEQAAADRVIAHLAAVGLPTHVRDVAGGNWPGVDTMMDLISQDKKVKRGQLTFILVRGIGQAFISRDVAADEVARLHRRKAHGPTMSVLATMSVMSDTIVNLLLAVSLLAAQRVFRCRGVCAGQEQGLPHQRDGGAESLCRAPAETNDRQHRGLSCVLPARHHHGRRSASAGSASRPSPYC